MPTTLHFIETWPSLSPNTLGLYVTYSWVSSAYLWYTTPRLRKIRCMGMAYIGNNIGPNTDPWGTPHARGMGSEMASSILTLCVRNSRYSCMSLARTAPCHAHKTLHLAETVADFGQLYQTPATNPVWHELQHVIHIKHWIYRGGPWAVPSLCCDQPCISW